MTKRADIAIERAFPAEYEVRLLAEGPAEPGPRWEFSRAGRGVHGGVLVEVVVEGRSEWIGLVANAPESVAAAHSGIYSTPSEGTLCVVARGDAYFIETAAPDQWWVLEDAPVVGVRSALAEELLVLATPWRVAAVGPDGLAWRTPRLAIDGIALAEVADGHLSGVADPEDDESREFVIDLRTGRHQGGFHFPDDAEST